MIKINYIKNNRNFYLAEEFFKSGLIINIIYDYDVDKMNVPLEFYKNIFFMDKTHHMILISRDAYIKRFRNYD